MFSFLDHWEHTDTFHVWTGAGFYLLTLVALSFGIYKIVQVYFAISKVEKTPADKWFACECKASVQKHLSWIVYTLSINSLIVLLVALYDLYFNWFEVPHEAHIVHYIICIAYLMDIKWGHASMKHFSGMSSCNGNVSYHVRKNKVLQTALREHNGN